MFLNCVKHWSVFFNVCLCRGGGRRRFFGLESKSCSFSCLICKQHMSTPNCIKVAVLVYFCVCTLSSSVTFPIGCVWSDSSLCMLSFLHFSNSGGCLPRTPLVSRPRNTGTWKKNRFWLQVRGPFSCFLIACVSFAQLKMYA